MKPILKRVQANKWIKNIWQRGWWNIHTSLLYYEDVLLLAKQKLWRNGVSNL